MQQLEAYHQSVLYTDDVAAQHGWFDLWHPDGFSLPGVTHAGDDVVSTHRGQLLAEDLSAPVGLVSVFGDDGSLRYHNAGAGILKLCIDADVFAFTETTAVNFCIE